jgi:hypothetical protein
MAHRVFPASRDLRSGQRTGELGEDRQVGMKPDPPEPSFTEVE